MRQVGWVLRVILIASASGPAFATDFLTELKSSPGYTVTVGADARIAPKFEGSDLYEFFPLPAFDIRPMGTPARFTAPRDGLGVTVFEAGKFNFGPVLYLEFARQVKSDPILAGSTDVKWAWEAGTFAEYWPSEWMRGRIELRKGFVGHHGVILDSAIDAIAPLNSQWTLSGGPRMRVADSSANSRYFDVTPEQSQASGLPAFDAKGGVRSVGAGGKLRYELNSTWATSAYLEYDRLVGDAARSPLVSTDHGAANQLMVGTGFTYSFDIAH
ncbi:MAG: MipA/OmpV family protein [Xanthobacteraceae bacterium]